MPLTKETIEKYELNIIPSYSQLALGAPDLPKEVEDAFRELAVSVTKKVQDFVVAELAALGFEFDEVRFRCSADDPGLVDELVSAMSKSGMNIDLDQAFSAVHHGRDGRANYRCRGDR